MKASASLDALGRLADIELSGKAHASWISLSERRVTGSRGQSLPLRFVLSREVPSCHVSYTRGSGFTCQQNDLKHVNFRASSLSSLTVSPQPQTLMFSLWPYVFCFVSHRAISVFDNPEQLVWASGDIWGLGFEV